MAVKDLAFTAYPANDVAKLAKFYEDVIGLQLNDTMGEGSEMKYAEFKVGSGWFSIITANGRRASQEALASLVCILPFNGQASVFGALGSSVKDLVALGKLAAVLALLLWVPCSLLKS